MSRVYKKTGKVTIYGSNRAIMLQYAKPDYSDDTQAYFMFKGTRHYMDLFMKIDWKDGVFGEFDGSMHYTAFSGVVIKIVDSATVKAFYYFG